MVQETDFLKVQNWFSVLEKYTFPTRFVSLDEETVHAVAEAQSGGDIPAAITEKMLTLLARPMKKTPGNCFLLADSCAPTDTDRYAAKRGAVHSPESAWRYFTASAKVRAAAAAGELSCIAIRPFRRMTPAREFRLFIREGELSAMSQYHLTRHFFRLDGIQKRLWKKAAKLVEAIREKLPVKTLVMDIYFTSGGKILILDLNPWGSPTDPLLLRKWDRDWSEPAGIVLMPAPTPIRGNVKVSF